MRRAAKNQMLDRMHRGVVYTCLGLTAYGSYLLGMRVYRYFTVIRPQRQEEELRMIQAGAVSDLDKAPTLKT
jgi:Cytochrome oxidase c assembly